MFYELATFFFAATTILFLTVSLSWYGSLKKAEESNRQQELRSKERTRSHVNSTEVYEKLLKETQDKLSRSMPGVDNWLISDAEIAAHLELESVEQLDSIRSIGVGYPSPIAYINGTHIYSKESFSQFKYHANNELKPFYKDLFKDEGASK